MPRSSRLPLFPLLLVVACTGTDDTGPVDGDPCVLSGVYTEDVHLDDSCAAWVLRGGVFVGDPERSDNDNTLRIDPGTLIYGDNATKGFLAIQRGAQIDAVGTAEAPIVFTSPVAEGSRARSDWGGIMLLGKAPMNRCSDGSDEVAGCEAEAEGGAGTYGGDEPNDSSGRMRYVRIEFGGIEITTENEVNGLALYSQGTGTELSYIQVHMNKDDAVEFFGGTASIDHVVVTGAGDDGFDWTDGWTGEASHVCVQQFPDLGDKGLEGDNWEDGFDALPRSAPVLSNFTLLGDGLNRLGMTLRHGTAADVSGFVVSGFDRGDFDIDSDATYAQLDDGAITVVDTRLAGSVPFGEDVDENGVPTEPDDADLEAWFLDGIGNALLPSADLDRFTPTAGGNVEGSGCIDGDDWTAGWTLFDPS